MAIIEKVCECMEDYCIIYIKEVSICLECNSSKLRGLKRKWIRCSAQATVLHLKKFIAKKLNLSSFNEKAFTSGNVVTLNAAAPRTVLKFWVMKNWVLHKSPSVWRAVAATRNGLCFSLGACRGSVTLMDSGTEYISIV
ncbi:polycomb group RING finger protein 3 isoform X4 [Macaca fascicularis]|uniref:polycomb group RING finger protein 3 isoform X4 n=1 Tax=Macaca fascicularis TaxID=9541 RepID=UPI003D15B504